MTDILTLHLDAASQAHFEQMRQRYFPPERNLIPAHLTLFHTLPRTDEITSTLEQVAERTASFALTVNGLRSLGRGVAYTLASAEAVALHRLLAAAFDPHLTPQDRQKFQPHVVIQNKATGEAARALLAVLQPGLQPFQVHAEGLDLWHYENGPWLHARTFLFGSS